MNSALKAVVLSSEIEYQNMASSELLCSLLLLLGSLSLFSLDFSLFFLESNDEGGLYSQGAWLLALGSLLLTLGSRHLDLSSSSNKQQAQASSARKIT